LQVLENPLAGDPQNDVVWTYLTPREISVLMNQEGVEMSVYLVLKLLARFGYGRRKMRKVKTLREVEGRNEQFENIASLRKEYANDLIISMDGKKKEYFGEFYRAGTCYCQEAIRVNDHDFSSEATGRLCPYGLYNVLAKQGCIVLGDSYETADFSVDALRLYLERYHCKEGSYPKRLLLLCDGGGANGSRNRLFKVNLERLSRELAIEIRVAHYPPYCSKYNPIEHCFFSHISRFWQGVTFENIKQVRQLTRLKAKLCQGLKIKVATLRKTYQKGKKITDLELKELNMKADEFFGKWNYTFSP
jgi:hypothetical protein